jgi:predicted phosphodiesterase
MASKSNRISVSYDEDWDKFCKWLGIAKSRIAKYPSNKIGKRVRYMMVNDLHIPFHNADAVTVAIEDGKKKGVNVLIVGGDTVDCYSLSRFSKYETVTIKDEISQARIFLDYSSRSFERVLLLSGNHEARERKYFSSKLSPEELEWLLSKPMLERITSDMENISVVKNINHNVDMNWFAPIGKDVIAGHPERSSVFHLKPVDDFRKWIDQWGDSLGVNPRPRMIIAGHSHNAGISWSGNTLIIENGCLCKFQAYAMVASLYNKPQRLAYTIWDMVDDKVDIQSVRQYYPLVG